MKYEPYISKNFLVVGEKHGCFISGMGVKRYVNDIKRTCDTLNEAEITVRQNNTPVYSQWGSYEPKELYRITQEAYKPLAADWEGAAEVIGSIHENPELLERGNDE